MEIILTIGDSFADRVKEWLKTGLLFLIPIALLGFIIYRIANIPDAPPPTQEDKDKGLRMDFDGLTVYDLRQFDANESLDNGDKLAKADGVRGGVLVSKDNRGPGDSFYRREDDPRVNFAKCQGKVYCAFAHAGGFILKTVVPGTDIPVVIADAKV